MGHANYLAAFLLWPIFAGTALWSVHPRDSQGAWRWLGGAAVVVGVAALVLAGSRGALLGLGAGASILVLLRRPRMRTVAASLVIFAIAAAAFYISPAGTRLRARAFWANQDSAGGARLHLWRDSLGMSAARPWAGFGSDTFVAVFPQFQSAEISRTYPDFSYESPHNMFLDVLTGQGAAGVVLLALLIITGVMAGLRAPDELRPFAGALLAGLVASVVAQQFVVFAESTAFTFYLGIGLLAGLESQGPRTVSMSMPLRTTVGFCSGVAAVFLATAGYRLVAADVTLAEIRNTLDAGHPSQAALLWEAQSRESAKSYVSVGVTADLYFSRRWAAAASTAKDPLERVRLGTLAIDAARSATFVAEQRQNAWYNFAMVGEALKDPRMLESSLRFAISASPRWFKPHWALARLLYSSGRAEEARKEASLAMDLDGNKDAEVMANTAEIIHSGPPATKVE